MRNLAFATPPAVLVAGSAELAHPIAAGLRRHGRPARLWLSQQKGSNWLLAAETLILADPTNPAEAIAEAADLCSKRAKTRPPLRLILLRRQGPAPERPPLDTALRLRLEYVALEDRAARLLLTRYPLHSGFDPRFNQPPHLLIAGTEPPSGSLLVQALRVSHYGPEPAHITIACTQPAHERSEFFARYPEAGQAAKLTFTRLEAPSLDDAPPVTSAYVCLSPAERGLMTARRLIDLIRELHRTSPLVHLEVGDATSAGSIRDWDGQILPFSYLDQVARPEVLLGEKGDELAELIHEHYRDTIMAQGRNPSQEPAGQPWDALDESYRNASRHQADHIWAKLAVTDCCAVAEDIVDTFAFTPMEVERLAVIEHRRWAADRYLDGWSFAPERDNVRKHHPLLIPFEQLSVPIKDLDRFAVRLVPTLLARRALGLVRSLLVGIPDDSGPLTKATADAILKRLAARYPDRRLILASTLEGGAARRLVQSALRRASAELYLLCRQPLCHTLEIQSDERTRIELLTLAAKASRRYCFADGPTLNQWYRERTEIIVTTGEAARGWDGKTIEVLPTGGGVRWGFEY